MLNEILTEAGGTHRRSLKVLSCLVSSRSVVVDGQKGTGLAEKEWSLIPELCDWQPVDLRLDREPIHRLPEDARKPHGAISNPRRGRGQDSTDLFHTLGKDRKAKPPSPPPPALPPSHRTPSTPGLRVGGKSEQTVSGTGHRARGTELFDLSSWWLPLVSLRASPPQSCCFHVVAARQR